VETQRATQLGWILGNEYQRNTGLSPWAANFDEKAAPWRSFNREVTQ